MTYGWEIIGIIAAVCLVIHYFPKDNFDPAKHICMDSCQDLCPEQCKIYPCKYEGHECSKGIIDECNKDHLTTWNHATCEKWRPKTFCETCIGSWTDECEQECKCTKRDCPEQDSLCLYAMDGIDYWAEIFNSTQDEYIKYSSAKMIRNYAFYLAGIMECTQAIPKTECEKGNPDFIVDEKIEEKYDAFSFNGTAFYCDDFPYSWDNQSLYDENCIRTSKVCREKTPCENDDPDYILDDDCWYMNHGIFISMTCFGKICRPKTINDYTCDELKEHIFLEDRYCRETNEWQWCPTSLTFRGETTRTLQTADIKKTYVDKGCKI